MEIVNGIERWPGVDVPLYLALGNFDGVHRGHQLILSRAVEAARSAGGAAGALIFDPHPSLMLRPASSLALLTDIFDRAALMAGLGLDFLVVESFTDKFASLKPEQFTGSVLKEKLGVAGVAIGKDYSFGAGGEGKAATMLSLGRKMDFNVTVSSLLRLNGQVVSSSAIRSLIESGLVKEAAQLLDYYFFRRGKVVRGDGIGRQMVYPTANISTAPGLIWPGKGVYLTAVGEIDQEVRFGVTNIGARPTFGREEAAMETHILDFDGDIYNCELRIHFLDKLRETRHFAKPEELREQIRTDIERGRAMINIYGGDLNVLTRPCGAFPRNRKTCKNFGAMGKH